MKTTTLWLTLIWFTFVGIIAYIVEGPFASAMAFYAMLIFASQTKSLDKMTRCAEETLKLANDLAEKQNATLCELIDTQRQLTQYRMQHTLNDYASRHKY